METCTLCDPDFHYYETQDTALDIRYITHDHTSRFIQCLVKHGCQSALDDNLEVVQELSPTIQLPETTHGNSNPSTPSLGPPTPQSIEVGGNLPTIYEENEDRDADELLVENFYAELMSDDPLEQDHQGELHGNMHPVRSRLPLLRDSRHSFGHPIYYP